MAASPCSLPLLLLLLFPLLFVSILASSDSPNSTVFLTPNSPLLDCDPSDSTLGFLTTIFAANGSFGFGCEALKVPGNVYLTVALLTKNYPSVPVWAANRHRPVKTNASLMVDTRGDLLLQDVDGDVVWRANTVGVVGLHLTDSGNLILFNSSNSTVWQSFDYPIDSLLPGQTLRPGQVLLSGFSSQEPVTGSYSAVMEPGGLVLYVNGSQQQLPYFYFPFASRLGTIDDAFQTPCNHTLLELSSDALSPKQEVVTAHCNESVGSGLSFSGNVTFDSPILYLRLDSDGDVRGYHMDFDPTFDWLSNNSRGVCDLPNICGRYGICNPNNSQRCSCPRNVSSSNAYADPFVQINTSNPSSGCHPQIAFDCDRGEDQQYLLELEGADYFANAFIPPRSLTSLDDCRRSCASNCSCQAAFYRKDTGACFHYEEVMSIIQRGNSSYVGFLKIIKRGSEVSERKLIIGISVCTAISLFFFGGWLFYRRKIKIGRAAFQEEDILSVFSGQPRRFKFAELQKATAQFSQKLGIGGFGSVYRGTFPDGSKVAVKQLDSARHGAKQGLKEFRAEVIALSNISHQNLVHLRGFCAEGSQRLLVYEYVPNGSLDAWIFHKSGDAPGAVLDWKTRLGIAIHTARGLTFLHEQCRNRIIHLDIKPQNILLDDKFVAKLSDFGLSKLIKEDESSGITRMRGTPGYMAPECLLVTDASEKSDVYGFGMVLLEIVSGRKNVDVSKLVLYGDGESWYFPVLAVSRYKEGKVEEIIDRGLGELDHQQKEEAKRVIQTAFWCIQDDPTTRPTMGNVLLMLEGHREVADPPLNFHFGVRMQQSQKAITSTLSKEDNIVGSSNAGSSSPPSSSSGSSSSISHSKKEPTPL